MFICPECARPFAQEEQLVKHYLRCWKENHPNHKAKEAPRSADRETHRIDPDIQAFFNGGKR